MADLAYVFGMQPSEIYAMDMDELRDWHAQIDRIQKQTQAANQPPS